MSFFANYIRYALDIRLGSQKDKIMNDFNHDPFAPRDTSAFLNVGDRRDSNRQEIATRYRMVKIGTNDVGEFHSCKGVLSLPGLFIERNVSGNLPDEAAIIEVEIPTGSGGDLVLVRAPVRPTNRKTGHLVMFDEDDFELARNIAQYLDVAKEDT